MFVSAISASMRYYQTCVLNANIMEPTPNVIRLVVDIQFLFSEE